MHPSAPVKTLPLLHSAEPSRPLVWSQGRAISVAEFLQSVGALASELPDKPYCINLCEQRHAFLVTFCAALLRKQTNLLPPSRAPETVKEILAAYPGAYISNDSLLERASSQSAAVLPDSLMLPADHLAVIGFTSGSTGQPQRHVKRWGNFAGSNAWNAARMRACLKSSSGTVRPWILATVPPQHMYGIETSVLLPLIADMAVHASRPLFPADIAAALAQMPQPRVLVTTPVHLRALMGADLRLPQLALVVSATAPLDRELAIAVETHLGAPLLEMFGATETCVFATREPAREDAWHVYPGVTLVPQATGTTIEAPWFDAPVVLQDILELLPAEHFLVRGRNADMIEVAGKRASLADLTQRLRSLPGVEDAVVFQPPETSAGVVRRVAALAVAPGLSAHALCQALARRVDAAFIPRPLVLVPALPRDELGKLPRERLWAVLRAQEDL